MAKKDITLSMHDDSFFVWASKEGVWYVGLYATCCSIDYEKAKAKYHTGLLVIDVPYRKLRERAIESQSPDRMWREGTGVIVVMSKSFS